MLNDVIVQRICDAVDSSFDDQLRFTQDLIAYPSQRGQEHTAQEFVYDAMRELGLSVDRWKIDVEEIRNHVGFSPVTIPYENAINVVGIHRPRQTEGRSLILTRITQMTL